MTSSGCSEDVTIQTSFKDVIKTSLGRLPEIYEKIEKLSFFTSWWYEETIL